MPGWSFSALDSFTTCPKKHYHTRIERDYKEAEGDALIWGKKVHKAFEDRVRKNTPFPVGMRQFEQYATAIDNSPGEKSCELSLAIDEDFQPCGWRSKKAWCRAKVDLIIVSGTHAVIIDYKTGRMKDDFDQVELSAAVVMCHNPEIVTATSGYLWLEDDESTSINLHRDDIHDVWNKFLPKVKRFNEAFQKQEWPPKPSGLCQRWCIVTGCPFHGK